MSDASYTAAEKRAGRRVFTVFGIFNAFSFMLLSGNIITLYLLRLGARSSFIGLVSSLTYISFFFMLIGKRSSRRTDVVKLFGYSWLFRYLSILPLLATPFLAAAGYRAIALVLVFLGLLGFNAFRGIGIVGQSPLMGELSSGPDRGAFIGRFQVVAHIASILTSLAIAALLLEDAPLARYAAFIGAGIASGLIGTMLILRLPTPRGVTEGGSESLLPAVKRYLERRNFRVFFLVFGMFSLIMGAIRPFIIVYAKQVFGQSDSQAILLAAIGSLGGIATALIARQVIDRIGAKPLFMLFSAVAAVVLVPSLLSPPFVGLAAFALLGFIFFAFHLGSFGAENAAQNYFYALLTPADQLNLGILYFLTLGLGGSVGSFVGGLAIDALSAVPGADPAFVFRWFFLVLLVLLALCTLAVSRLQRLGAYSFRGALGVILSLRDLRAINLLNRLDKTTSISGEQKVIQELAGSKSGISVDTLLAKLDSPSFTIRREALYALQELPSDPRIEEALCRQITEQPFTTAPIAARIVGYRGYSRAIEALRWALGVDDYLLVGESMIALARLGDYESIDAIERIVKTTANPHLLIYGAGALKLFKRTSSVAVLLGVLRRDDVPVYLRDEIIFALSEIFSIQEWMYPMYTEFLKHRHDGVSLLAAESHRCQFEEDIDEHEVRELLEILPTVVEEAEDRTRFGDLSARILGRMAGRYGERAELDRLAQAAVEQPFFRFDRFTFFLVALIVRLLCSAQSGAPPREFQYISQ
jgi:hypothetical protein